MSSYRCCSQPVDKVHFRGSAVLCGSAMRGRMHAPGDDDRFSARLRACTAELARIIDSDLDRAVPTCLGWVFRQLATHLRRGHRWAARMVATRATAPLPVREVADGTLPEDPARHASYNCAACRPRLPAWTSSASRPCSPVGSTAPRSDKSTSPSHPRPRSG